MAAGLEVAMGLASRTGRRPDNQDFCAACLGAGAERGTGGVVAVLADGVGGAEGGRIAAELACRSFIEAYRCLPPTLGIAARADRAIAGYNRWLHTLGATAAGMEGAATTFAALIVRDRAAHALHCGDSRIWHFRQGVLIRMTKDHSLAQPGRRHVLYRAVGLEPAIRLDCTVQFLAVRDRLLMTSDGVHDVLSHRALTRLLKGGDSAERDAAAIVQAALAAGATDNVSAVVADIVALPDGNSDSVAADGAGPRG